MINYTKNEIEKILHTLQYTSSNYIQSSSNTCKIAHNPSDGFCVNCSFLDITTKRCTLDSNCYPEFKTFLIQNFPELFI